MANSPRPGVWALERSVDHGQTWQTWQFFAGNDAECMKFFNVHADAMITADDQVICSTEVSKVRHMSVTRFGEISPLWHNFKSIWAIFEIFIYYLAKF